MVQISKFLEGCPPCLPFGFQGIPGILKPRKFCWRSIAAEAGSTCCWVNGAVAPTADIMGLPATALCLLYLSSISLRRRLLFLPALMTRRRRWVGGWKYLHIDLSDGTLDLNLAWCAQPPNRRGDTCNHLLGVILTYYTHAC